MVGEHLECSPCGTVTGPHGGARFGGGGLAGGAAVALAEKNGLYPKTDGHSRLTGVLEVGGFSTDMRGRSQRAGRIAVLGRNALQTSSFVSM